ncbi:response regulator [Pseudoalteromonas denitrificans]|uniref:Two-component system, OmpR family, response regulator BaeR n=1 Tax=Pseudoalteromonas denitrificans DSM 6059 TaxID=1123010 RepID=A0A1I1PFU5_9GAMM|nr:response regulator [Pseudoalteromonas denitrificans]SFD04930.1 two-component system, OmpR family, response regulator BaeR [Pseudoalteromonas denitrificans DSM 6059]
MEDILIVEDEHEIADHLARFFQASGFSTSHIDEGTGVVDAVKRKQPSLIVLDLMLPGKDGLSCCKEIREFSNVPIIMLTAKVDEIDRLIGLEAGADDYVCKPFSAPELVMRVKAILKRTKNQVSYQLLTVDTDKQLVFYQKTKINLTSLEYALFSLLYKYPERIYSRQQIIDSAYPDLRDITDRAIDSHIKNIRKRFKQASVEEKIIESVYGAGYKLVLP